MSSTQSRQAEVISPEHDLPVATETETAAGAIRSPWKLVAAAFFENKYALVGLAFLILEVAFCFLGPLLYHTHQLRADITSVNLPPSGQHLLGTDNNGFDIVGRLMAGGQNSLIIGVAVALVSTSIGTMWGAISGFLGGIADAVMSRILDVFLSIPAIFIFIYLATIFKPTVPLLILVLSGLSWLIPGRLIRGETLTLRTREYVQAARIMGAGPFRIVLTHILRNVVSTLVVNVTFQTADAILLLATLDFFGFGLPPPAPSWGGMLSGGINYLYDGYWWQIYPAAAMIAGTILAFSVVGDALRDSLEVRLQRR